MKKITTSILFVLLLNCNLFSMHTNEEKSKKICLEEDYYLDELPEDVIQEIILFSLIPEAPDYGRKSYGYIKDEVLVFKILTKFALVSRFFKDNAKFVYKNYFKGAKEHYAQDIPWADLQGIIYFIKEGKILEKSFYMHASYDKRGEKTINKVEKDFKNNLKHLFVLHFFIGNIKHKQLPKIEKQINFIVDTSMYYLKNPSSLQKILDKEEKNENDLQQIKIYKDKNYNLEWLTYPINPNLADKTIQKIGQTIATITTFQDVLQNYSTNWLQEQNHPTRIFRVGLGFEIKDQLSFAQYGELSGVWKEDKTYLHKNGHNYTYTKKVTPYYTKRRNRLFALAKIYVGKTKELEEVIKMANITTDKEKKIKALYFYIGFIATTIKPYKEATKAIEDYEQYGKPLEFMHFLARSIQTKNTKLTNFILKKMAQKKLKKIYAHHHAGYHIITALDSIKEKKEFFNDTLNNIKKHIPEKFIRSEISNGLISHPDAVIAVANALAIKIPPSSFKRLFNSWIKQDHFNCSLATFKTIFPNLEKYWDDTSPSVLYESIPNCPKEKMPAPENYEPMPDPDWILFIHEIRPNTLTSIPEKEFIKIFLPYLNVGLFKISNFLKSNYISPFSYNNLKNFFGKKSNNNNFTNTFPPINNTSNRNNQIENNYFNESNLEDNQSSQERRIQPSTQNNFFNTNITDNNILNNQNIFGIEGNQKSDSSDLAFHDFL